MLVYFLIVICRQYISQTFGTYTSVSVNGEWGSSNHVLLEQVIMQGYDQTLLGMTYFYCSHQTVSRTAVKKPNGHIIEKYMVSMVSCSVLVKAKDEYEI